MNEQPKRNAHLKGLIDPNGNKKKILARILEDCMRLSDLSIILSIYVHHLRILNS